MGKATCTAVLLIFLIGILPYPAKADSVMDDIVQSSRIINVHEHIQHEANVPELLEVMDKMGIQKRSSSVVRGSHYAFTNPLALQKSTKTTALFSTSPKNTPSVSRPGLPLIQTI